MRQHKAYRAYRPRAKAAKEDRPNGAAYLLVIAGLLTGQLLLLISP